MFPKHPRLVWILAVAGLLLVAFLIPPTRSANAQSAWSAMAMPSPSTFIRWGNDTAPPGTRLVYSGFAYGSYYGHSGGNEPIVLATGDPGTTMVNDGNLLYPLQTGASNVVPPGVAGDREIVGAVCEAPNRTTIIWGTHTAPPGWTVLYKGYAMGARYSHESPVGPICVDADAFDASHPMSGSSGSLVYGTKVSQAAGGSTDVSNAFVKAAVIMKL